MSITLDLVLQLDKPWHMTHNRCKVPHQ